MTAAVAMTRTELDAAGLRRAVSQADDAAAARRMLALALVLDGRSRTEAAEQWGMDRQTLRDWVHRYNAEGLAGLSDRPSPGAKPRLSPEQDAEVARLVREGPVLVEHGVIRWRRIDLSRVIEARFGVRLAERSVGALLRRLGFRRLSARPRHPGHDAAPQAAHKNFAELVAGAIPERAREADRAVVARRSACRPAGYADPTVGRARLSPARPARLPLRLGGAGQGSASEAGGMAAEGYIFGAVCPARGAGAALVLPYANAEAMNLHLAEISRRVAQGAHAVVTVDGAGWHKEGGHLHVPDNISLLLLPPDSPELNPQENVWQFLRQNYLANRVFDTYDAIVDACCDAWNKLPAEPNRITAIATREWARSVNL